MLKKLLASIRRKVGLTALEEERDSYIEVMKECAQETNEIQRAYDKLIKKYDENEAALRESEKDFETLQAQFAAYRRQSDRRRSTIETMLTNWPTSV